MHQDGFGSERYFHCFKYECLWVPEYFLLRRSATSSWLSQLTVRHHLPPPGCASTQSDITYLLAVPTHTVRLFFSSKGGWANSRAWNWLFDSFSIWICCAPFKGQWSLTLSVGGALAQTASHLLSTRCYTSGRECYLFFIYQAVLEIHFESNFPIGGGESWVTGKIDIFWVPLTISVLTSYTLEALELLFMHLLRGL